MIKIENVSKSFGILRVLKGINVQIPKGQATGIVGPNGSGKTTLIKHILGLVKPDSGTLSVNGNTLNGTWRYRDLIGYMPQQARYPENMKVKELFDFIQKIRGRAPIRKEELIERFELQSELEKPLRTLSGGNRQKVGATLAFMFEPEILILDEPTAGLDPKASYRFKQLVLEEKKRGKTVLLTSHIMSEIEELTDHIVFLIEGNIHYDGPMLELMELQKEERLETAVAKMMEDVTA